MAQPRLLSAVALTETTVRLSFDQDMLQDAVFFDVANYAVTSQTVAFVGAPTTSTALLTLSPGMLAGAALVATVDASLSNTSAETMEAGFTSANFLGQGTPPALSSVVATTSTTIRVTFDGAVQNNASLSNVATYLVSSDLGIPVTVSACLPQAVGSPTYVDLNVTEMTNGAAYVLRISPSAFILDVPGNVLDPNAPSNRITFAGMGTLPDVGPVQVLGPKSIRITFNEGMKRDSALASPSNYTIIPVTPGAAAVYVESVFVPVDATPAYVEIETTEMTDGASYTAIVSGPTDPYLNPIDNNTVNFTGVGQAPVISKLEAVSRNRVDLTFDEPMADNVDLKDPARYTWDNGLLTLAVLEVTPGGTIKLVTSDQLPGILYTLTVDPS